MIAHNVILWPTRESLKVVDSQTGATLENKPLLTGGSAEIGGNLTVSQGMLLVAQPMRLVAYCEYSLLKKRLERELSERMNSDDHRTPLIATPVESGKRTRQMSTESLFGQLADVELAEGNVETAVETLQRAIETMESTGELDKATMVRFENLSLELLRKEGRKALSEGDAALALTRLRKARQRASEPGDVVAILLDMANAELALNRPVAAVELWQQILDDSRLRDVSMRDSTAATEVAKDISLLIEKRGPAAYSAIEQRAAHEISMLLKANDLEGLHRVLPKYPNAEVSGQAWRQLATLDRQAGRFASALDIQTRQLDPTGSHKTLANLLVDRAETLQAAGYWRPARTIWKRLGTEQFSNHDIESGGESQRVGELARVRLQNPEYKVYEPAEQPVARYLDREWSIDLSSTGGLSDAPLEGIPRQDDVAVLVPRNDPPALNLACVLVPRQDTTIGAGRRWECLDRATGQVRWSRSLTAAPQWSAYAESHLLLATDTNLTAISLETGRDIWSTPLTKPVESVGRLVMGEGGPAQVAERTARPSKPVSTVKICIRDDAVFTFDSRTGAAAVDGRTGQVLWSFSPPRGKLQQQWSCGSRRIALQTVQPAITWSIDIATGRVSERPGATEPWLQGPVVDDDDAMVFVSADRRIESRSNANGRSLWRYRGGMSFAHVDPVLWSDGSQLLLSIDGTTLASVNRTTGTPNWSTGLADRPLKTPASQVITHGDAAFAASHGLLRRISLKYGDCQWERFLGTATDQWRVCACGELIAAWPVESKTEINSSGPRQIVVWCDARTGRIIQRMSIANEERMINVTGDERGCLVQTDRSLIAFRAAGDRADVVSAVR